MAEVRAIVRFLATDIEGHTKLMKALRKIRGVSFMFANAVCIVTNINPNRKIGELSESELKALENAIKSPALPSWMLNRRKDINLGADTHLAGSQLDFEIREDINFMKRMRSYKGVRHELGQPVRGQRTRSSFRTQKTVGVSRKAMKEAAKPAKKEEQKKEAAKK